MDHIYEAVTVPEDGTQIAVYDVTSENITEIAEYPNRAALEAAGWHLGRHLDDHDFGVIYDVIFNIDDVAGITVAQRATARVLAESWEGSLFEAAEAARHLDV